MYITESQLADLCGVSKDDLSRNFAPTTGIVNGVVLYTNTCAINALMFYSSLGYPTAVKSVVRYLQIGMYYDDAMKQFGEKGEF